MVINNIFIAIGLLINTYFSPEKISNTNLLEQKDSIFSIAIISAPPVYEGNLKEFILVHLKYPEQAIKDRVKGIVYVGCQIDSSGLTTNHSILRGIREDVNLEALRVARLIKFKHSAYQKNIPVKVSYVIPVEFNYNNNENLSFSPDADKPRGSTILDSRDDIGWVIYEDVPYFKGNLHKFIKKHLKYPPTALRDTLESKVYVEFIVDTNGFTLSHKIIKGVRPDVDEEALRVARLIKFDKPAMQRGRPVEFKYCLSFVFDLSKRKKNRESRKSMIIPFTSANGFY